jgi:type 1 glutamine amidotransferase
VVIYHFAMAAFNAWTEYEKMSGGNWRTGNGHHSAPHDFVVDIKDPDHPITKGLKLSFPQGKDELYGNLRWQPAGSYHVLATAYDDHELYKAGRTDAKAPQPLEGPGAHQPMLWTVDYGKGRVFVTALGHVAENVSDPGVRDHVRARNGMGRHRKGHAADSGRNGQITGTRRRRGRSCGACRNSARLLNARRRPPSLMSLIRLNAFLPSAFVALRGARASSPS